MQIRGFREEAICYESFQSIEVILCVCRKNNVLWLIPKPEHLGKREKSKENKKLFPLSLKGSSGWGFYFWFLRHNWIVIDLNWF
jgi:hypothetical protein